MPKLVMYLALLCAPSLLSAQNTLVTNAPGATYRTEVLQEVSDGLQQTFLAAGNRLLSFSFWPTWQIYYAEENSGSYTRIFIVKGTDALCVAFGCNKDQVLASSYVTPVQSGPSTVLFESGIPMELGELYSVIIQASGCYLSQTGCFRGTSGGNNLVDVSNEDSYAGGELYKFEGLFDPDRRITGDLRFEAVFVPEPSAALLLATGLASIAYVIRRNRTS